MFVIYVYLHEHAATIAIKKLNAMSCKVYPYSFSDIDRNIPCSVGKIKCELKGNCQADKNKLQGATLHYKISDQTSNHYLIYKLGKMLGNVPC